MTSTNAATLRLIADRIDGAPSVARRSGGITGTVASYLPGERLLGVSATPEGRLVVHVVMLWGFTVDEVESDVFAAIGTDWPNQLVDITVDDLDVPPAISPQLSLGDEGRSLPLPGAGPEPSPPGHVPTL